MRFIFITYCLLFFFNSAFLSHAQTDSTTKKIELFPKEYGDKKWKFLLGLDARRSYFNGAPVKINGVKIGAEFRGVHRFGIGIYWLKKNAVFMDVPLEQEDALHPTEVRFDLSYSSLFYERIFLKTRWWEIAFPIHLAGGSVSAYYRDTLSAIQPWFKKPFSALLFSTQVKFFPLPWMALRVSGGYRITFNTEEEIKDAFNTPFYGFGLSINVVDLYHSIKLRREIKQHKKENQRVDYKE